MGMYTELVFGGMLKEGTPKKTKRWYDYINMFSQYNTKQSEYSFRSEQLEKFQKRLTKHTEKVVELTSEEFDFIFDWYFL